MESDTSMVRKMPQTCRANGAPSHPFVPDADGSGVALNFEGNFMPRHQPISTRASNPTGAINFPMSSSDIDLNEISVIDQ